MAGAATTAKPLAIGPLELDVPVVLAPMAGITNTAFRRLCREYGAGLYVSEMITSRALVERTPTSMRLIKHHESETPRSIQLYGVEPTTISESIRFLVDEDRCDHIDLNFGCPVPKVTRKGAGVASIALHARTASQFYSGHADWDAIGELKSKISGVPVLGNGDIWSAEDALAMVKQSECDGVVVGRGCLGRPWLFGDLQAAFKGEGLRIRPGLGAVAQAFRRHAELLVEFFDGDEDRACRDIRKHV